LLNQFDWQTHRTLHGFIKEPRWLTTHVGSCAGVLFVAGDVPSLGQIYFYGYWGEWDHA